jgi:hypothetical protein
MQPQRSNGLIKNLLNVVAKRLIRPKPYHGRVDIDGNPITRPLSLAAEADTRIFTNDFTSRPA